MMKTQDTNLGDLLINKLLINLLVEQKKTIIFDTSEIKLSFCKQVLSDIKNPTIFSTKRDISYYIKFIFAPVYFDAIILPPGANRTATIFDLKLVLILLYLKLIRIKLIRIGKSFSQGSPLGATIEKLIAYLSHFTIVRDKKSLKRVQFHKKQKNISCASDLIVLLDTNDKTTKHQSTYFIASFRYSHLDKKQKAEFVQKAASFLFHYGNKYKLKIKLTWQVEVDKECMKEIAAELKKMSVESELEKIELSNFQEKYRSASILVSNRLHVALTGIVLKVNSWALCEKNRDSKIIDAFDELGLQNRIINFGKNFSLLNDYPIKFDQDKYKSKLVEKIIEATNKD